jgi:hypothetical protein
MEHQRGFPMESSMENWRAHQMVKCLGSRMENLMENWMARQMAKYSGTCWEYHLG